MQNSVPPASKSCAQPETVSQDPLRDAALHAAFEVFNAKQRGKIDSAGLPEELSKTGISVDEVRRLSELPASSGTIDFAQFSELLEKDEPALESTWKCFKQWVIAERAPMWLLGVHFMSLVILICSTMRNSADPELASYDMANKSFIFPSLHVVAVVLLACVLVMCLQLGSAAMLQWLDPSCVQEPRARINAQILYVYVAMAFFLFSAEMFNWAPYIRYYNMLPFMTFVGCALYIESKFLHQFRATKDWPFVLGCFPMLFLIYCSREAHIMIAGFCFSVMEFVYNAPPTLARAIHNALLYSALYALLLVSFGMFYGGVEAELEEPVNWKVECCFMLMILPFRIPVLWQRNREKAAAEAKEADKKLETSQNPQATTTTDKQELKQTEQNSLGTKQQQISTQVIKMSQDLKASSARAGLLAEISDSDKAALAALQPLLNAVEMAVTSPLKGLAAGTTTDQMGVLSTEILL